jgi:hypothetical protein
VYLAKCPVLIIHAAQSECDNGGVETAISEAEVLGHSVDDLHLDAGHLGAFDCPGPQIRLGLDRYQMAYATGVVRKIGTVAGAHLEHPPGEAGERAVPILGHAAVLHRAGEAGEDAGENGSVVFHISTMMC